MKLTFSSELYRELLDEAERQDKPMARLINEVLTSYVIIKKNKPKNTYSKRENEKKQQPTD